MNKDFFLQYKIPLIFAMAGAVALLLAIVFSWLPGRLGKERSREIEIEEATVAGELSRRTIFVDLEGAVKTPGIYEMEEEARVADLLEKAGGLTEKADLDWVGKNINRAQKLIDGAKIYIPFKGDITILPASSAGGRNYDIENNNKININTASASELESLEGVGEKTAEKIINGRPYAAIEELLEKKIVGAATFEKIKEGISVF